MMTVAMLKGTQELDERAVVSAARGGYVRLRRSREDRHRQEKSKQREFAFHPDLLKSIAHNGVLCEAALGESHRTAFHRDGRFGGTRPFSDRSTERFSRE
jgi:hypothetical protein